MYTLHSGKIHRLLLAPLLSLILLGISPFAWAKPVIFLLDTSQQMAVQCPGSGVDYLTLAREYIDGEANRGRLVRVSKGSLYGFSDSPKLLIPLTRTPAELVDGADLAPHGERTPLAAILDDLGVQAQQMEIDRARLLIISRLSQGDLSPALGSRIEALTRSGWEVEFVQIGPGDRGALQRYFATIHEVPCQASSAPPAPRTVTASTDLLQEIRSEATELLGLAEGELGLESDFIDDLGIDRMLAYDVMAQICASHTVEAPLRDDLTSVRRIGEYIASAPAIQTSGDMIVRGDNRPDGGSREPIELRTVFFGTNRALTGHTDPAEFFSGDRAPRGKVSYGRCEVSIPVAVHQRGVMESPPMGIQMLADPHKHIILKQVDLLKQEQFFRAIKQTLQSNRKLSDQGEDLLVFIHGYNVMFEEAARRTAQVAYDLDFGGVPVFFSWPSDGKIYAYVSDREDVEWSVPHIRDFLLDVVNRAGAKRVHLITHSMGHEGLLRALNLIAVARQGAPVKPLFDNIIMAAPDFDAQIFSEQLITSISPLSRQWTLYASDKDMALNVSAKLRFATRLGLPLTVVQDVVTIDATGVEVTPWSVPEFHTYFATKQRVISDIVDVLHGKRPTERAIQQGRKERLPYWKLNVLQ